MFDLTPNTISWIIQALIILILSVCVHEWGHAFIADKLGDATPRAQGRVTLNPLKHADPLGTLAFPLIALVYSGGASSGFGWGKPVEVQPHSFSRRYPMRTGHMFVALAGPLTNVVFGTLVAITHMLLLKFEVISASGSGSWPPDSMSQILAYAVRLNFILFFFNLIPAPPLDGGAVLEGLLPTRYLPAYQRLAVYGPFVLMAVIFIPQLARIFLWPASKTVEGLYSLLGAILF